MSGMAHVTYGNITRDCKPGRPVTVHLDRDDTAWTPEGTVPGPGSVTYTRVEDETGSIAVVWTPGAGR
jgi:hypothetical protein